MQVILKFCLIVILFEEAFSSGVCYNNYACVKLKNYSLKIPDDNPIIKGEKDDARDIWYTYVNWLDNPAGNLTLSYWTEYYYNKTWNEKSSGTLNVYDQGKLERFYWAELARKALGLHRPNVKIPGKVRVNRNLFPKDKCIGINFETPWVPSLKYRIWLHVTDDKKKVFLIGQIIKHPQ